MSNGRDKQLFARRRKYEVRNTRGTAPHGRCAGSRAQFGVRMVTQDTTRRSRVFALRVHGSTSFLAYRFMEFWTRYIASSECPPGLDTSDQGTERSSLRFDTQRAS